MQQKKNSFSGSIGFVLAAAGSAVGVGNIWRFPYLCAKDGGGLFLIIYLVLVLTFGFVLLTTDIAIGRKTKKNALNAYAAISSKWKFLGYLTFLVPALIMTYYSVIGGWIVKYLTAYVVSGTEAPAQDGYFTSFITSTAAPIVFMFIFLVELRISWPFMVVWFFCFFACYDDIIRTVNSIIINIRQFSIEPLHIFFFKIR